LEASWGEHAGAVLRIALIARSRRGWCCSTASMTRGRWAWLRPFRSRHGRSAGQQLWLFFLVECLEIPPPE
jgi:hypothetical protein